MASVAIGAGKLSTALGQGGFGMSVPVQVQACVCPQPPIPPTPPIPAPPAPGVPFTNGIFNQITTNEGDALSELASQYRE